MVNRSGRNQRLRAALCAACIMTMVLCPPPAAHAGAVPAGGMVADVVARVEPSVVRIIAVHPPEKQSEPMAGGNRSAMPPKAGDALPITRIGSGFAIIQPGLIATNRHVVERTIAVFVEKTDGTRYKADIVGLAARTDIALLRIDPSAGLPVLSFGDSDKLRPGDMVIAIGSPFGFENTVTAGIVSSVNRDIMESPFDDYIQTDAAINHGNSGGPLFNAAGEVVGMNSVLIAPGQGSAGLGFAIPSDQLRFVLDRLNKYGEVRAGMLPIRTQEVTGLMAQAIGVPHAGGALIASLQPDAGLMAGQIHIGDVITAFNGERVSDPRDLARKAGAAAVGGKVELTLYRGGQETKVSVPILPLGGPVPAAAADPSRQRGIGLRFVPGTAGRGGVRLADVDASGSAAASGLMKGDTVLRVQQTAVSTPEQAQKALQARVAEKAAYAAVLIERAGEQIWLPVALPN